MSSGHDRGISIARQAILDQRGKVFGYELLYRDHRAAASPTSPDDSTDARILTDALLDVGLEALTGGLPAFVKLTPRLLLSGAGTLLPCENVVLELHDHHAASHEVAAECRRLRDMGYKMALDDYMPGSHADELLPWMNFIKIDAAHMPVDDVGPLAMRLRPKGLRLVAESVETAEVANEAVAAGYSLLQGQYFCKPTAFLTTPLPARRLVYMNLLATLNRESLSLDDVEDLVKHDLSLSYHVLRSINSAAYGLRQEVTSIRRALMLLGVAQIRKWASVWSLAGLSEGGTPETVSVALLRARCCEFLGEKLPESERDGLFLLGLCSLLDAILNRRMEDALSNLPLPERVREALLGTSNTPRTLLDAVIAYERGDWDEAAAAAERVGLAADLLQTAYGDALKWARQLQVARAA